MKKATLGTGSIYLHFTPVFASAASYGRAWGTATRLSVAGLLSAYTTGNTTRELASVATGSLGTPARVSGGLILLAPTHNAAETFQYAIQLTGYPASLATNTLTLSVTNAVGMARAISYSGGVVTVTFSGVPGYNYVVERAGAVNGPWTTLNGSSGTPDTRQAAPTSGVWTFTDTSPPSPAFYRTRQNN